MATIPMIEPMNSTGTGTPTPGHDETVVGVVADREGDAVENGVWREVGVSLAITPLVDDDTPGDATNAGQATPGPEEPGVPEIPETPTDPGEGGEPAVDSDVLTRLYQEALSRRQAQREAFLHKLRETSRAFAQELETDVRSFITGTASSGRRSGRMQFRYNYSAHYGGVRVSTLIKGFRRKDGEWDTSALEAIGYDKTPFDAVVRRFAEKGIHVKNISNEKRSLNVWLFISF